MEKMSYRTDWYGVRGSWVKDYDVGMDYLPDYTPGYTDEFTRMIRSKRW